MRRLLACETLAALLMFSVVVAMRGQSSISGSATLTVTGPTGALLTGCSFIGTGGCSLPSGGWSVVAQQDFECVNSHANPANPSCGVLPGSQGTSSNRTPNGFETVQAKTGTFGFGGQYGGDGDQVNWILGSAGSFNTIYISFWEYTDPNAMYGNSDYYIWHTVSAGTCGGIVQDLAYDAQPGVLGGPPVSNSFTLPITNGQLGVAGCQGFYQEGNGSFNLPMDPGTWRQIEIQYTPSTSVTPNPSTNHALTPCLSPTQTNCGNGDLSMWRNGTLMGHSANANLNGTTNMNGADIEIGGVITVFCDAAELMRANPFSVCPSIAPSPFHRYFDNVIILKK